MKSTEPTEPAPFLVEPDGEDGPWADGWDSRSGATMTGHFDMSKLELKLAAAYSGRFDGKSPQTANKGKSLPSEEGWYWLLNGNNFTTKFGWECIRVRKVNGVMVGLNPQNGREYKLRPAEKWFRAFPPDEVKEDPELVQARELITKLKQALAMSTTWLKSCLNCKTWLWDADQHEAASATVADSEDLLK